MRAASLSVFHDSDHENQHQPSVVPQPCQPAPPAKNRPTEGSLPCARPFVCVSLINLLRRPERPNKKIASGATAYKGKADVPLGEGTHVPFLLRRAALQCLDLAGDGLCFHGVRCRAILQRLDPAPWASRARACQPAGGPAAQKWLRGQCVGACSMPTQARSATDRLARRSSSAVSEERGTSSSSVEPYRA